MFLLLSSMTTDVCSFGRGSCLDGIVSLFAVSSYHSLLHVLALLISLVLALIVPHAMGSRGVQIETTSLPSGGSIPRDGRKH